jgi:hypothetical protein
VSDQLIGVIHVGTSVLIANIALSGGAVTKVWADVTRLWATFTLWKGEVSYYDPVHQIFYLPISKNVHTGLEQLAGFPIANPDAYTEWPVPNVAWNMVAVDWSAARQSFVVVVIDAGQHNPAELPQLIVEYVPANATWNILYKFPPSNYLWPNEFGILDLAGGGTIAVVQALAQGTPVITYVDLTTGTLLFELTIAAPYSLLEYALCPPAAGGGGNGGEGGGGRGDAGDATGAGHATPGRRRVPPQCELESYEP